MAPVEKIDSESSGPSLNTDPNVSAWAVQQIPARVISEVTHLEISPTANEARLWVIEQ